MQSDPLARDPRLALRRPHAEVARTDPRRAPLLRRGWSHAGTHASAALRAGLIQADPHGSAHGENSHAEGHVRDDPLRPRAVHVRLDASRLAGVEIIAFGLCLEAKVGVAAESHRADTTQDPGQRREATALIPRTVQPGRVLHRRLRCALLQRPEHDIHDAALFPFAHDDLDRLLLEPGATEVEAAAAGIHDQRIPAHQLRLAGGVDTQLDIGDIVSARITHAKDHAGQASLDIAEPLHAVLLHDPRTSLVGAGDEARAGSLEFASVSLPLAMLGRIQALIHARFGAERGRRGVQQSQQRADAAHPKR